MDFNPSLAALGLSMPSSPTVDAASSGKPRAATSLAPADEMRFQMWAQGLPWYSEFKKKYDGEEPNLNDPQYDYRAAYQAGISPQRYDDDGGSYHWPSTLPDGTPLKLGNHPTSWMEHFMQASGGKDPNDLMLNGPTAGAQWISRNR